MTTDAAAAGRTTGRTGPPGPDLDVVVVGAGFSGLYLLHRLRGLGFTARASRPRPTWAAPGTGTGTREPAATSRRPTTPTASTPSSRRSGRWSEKYATQPEILAYLDHVADRFDLRRDIVFAHQVVAAAWDEAAARWTVAPTAATR